MRQMRISADAQGLIPKFINFLYPSQCPSCSKETDSFSTAPFCSVCWSGIKKYAGPSCRVCATPFASEDASVCGECMKKPPYFSKAISYGLFDGTLAAAIHFFKFQRIKRLHRPLGDLLLSLDLPGIDALIPVPLTIRSLRERGFNQSLLLAKAVSEKIKTPLIMDGLLKETETAPQIGLSKKERRLNLKGTFRTGRKFHGMRLLLIDDVMTTCSTADECSKELLRAGAVEVTVLTLARANYL
jgi:competence protein ComFC